LARIMYDYASFCTYIHIYSMATWIFILDHISVLLVFELLQGAAKGKMALLIVTVEFTFK
jgi:hypothetical protein